MNGDDFHERIEAARERRCNFAFVREYFGLDFASDEALRRDFLFWMRQRRNDEPLSDETVDRWWLEMFLQDRRLLPVKWAALQLGMTQESFMELRRELGQAGPQLMYHPSPDLVGSSFEQDVFGQFQLRTRPASANGHDPLHHNSTCQRIHAWIADEFGFVVQPEYCRTSRRVGHQPPHFAKYLDILMLEPVSPVYQVWLDFGKWLTLPPDRCSLYGYAVYQAEVARYLAGREAPHVPPEIEALVEGAPH